MSDCNTEKLSHRQSQSWPATVHTGGGRGTLAYPDQEAIEDLIRALNMETQKRLRKGSSPPCSVRVLGLPRLFLSYLQSFYDFRK